MKRSTLLKNIGGFLDRYHDVVEYIPYVTTADQADAPYRQRKKQYGNAIELKACVLETRIEDAPSPIGNRARRCYEVCTSPDELLKSFHPLDYDDPRVNRDPSILITSKDRIRIVDNDVLCTITAINRHGNDGAGPLWYVIECDEVLDD